jgi:hypothetical protein
MINGFDVPVAIPDDQTCTIGNGTTVADECVVPFDEDMPEKDMVAAVEGYADPGTFLLGSNRIIAVADDIKGNRTFNTDTIFALGPVLKPKKTLYAQVNKFVETEVKPHLLEMSRDIGNALENETTINPAFVAGVKEAAASEFLNAVCQDAMDKFTSDLSAALAGQTLVTFKVEPDCSCNMYDIPIVLEGLTFTNHMDPCTVDFRTGELDFILNLPDIHMQVGAHRSCTTRFLGMCVARTVVDVTTVIDVKDLLFTYTVTETAIENKEPDEDALKFTWMVYDESGEPLYDDPGYCDGGSNNGADCFSDGQCPPAAGAGVCANGPDKGNTCSSNSDCDYDTASDFGNKCLGGENQGKSCRDDTDCPGGNCYAKCKGTCADLEKNEDFSPVKDWDFPVECLGGWICTFFDTAGRFIVGAFAELFTWGDFEWMKFTWADQVGFGGFEFEESFLADLNLAEPDAMGVSDIGISEDALRQSGSSSSERSLTIDVEIENGALTLAAGAEFATECVDPEIDGTPGASLTPARAPTVSEVTSIADDVSLMLADDVFNQIFASQKECGRLRAFCTDDAQLRTVGDVLPDDCETLPTPKAQGICHALREHDCSSLSGLPREKGVCHGWLGHTCNSLPYLQQDHCAETEPRDIRYYHALRLCAKVDNDPLFTIEDDDTLDSTVTTALLLKQASVLFVLYRANDGYTGNLNDLSGCDSEEGNAATDCRIFATCLNLSLKAEMGIDSSPCSPNEAGFVFQVKEIKPSETTFGVMCSGGGNYDEEGVLEKAFESIVIDKVSENAEAFTPPTCVEGLQLSGVLDFSGDAKMFGLSTNGTTPYADFLGITVGLNPPP